MIFPKCKIWPRGLASAMSHTCKTLCLEPWLTSLHKFIHKHFSKILQKLYMKQEGPSVQSWLNPRFLGQLRVFWLFRSCRTAQGRRWGFPLHQPGIEPGSQDWESCMIPLHHWCFPLIKPPWAAPECKEESCIDLKDLSPCDFKH